MSKTTAVSAESAQLVMLPVALFSGWRTDHCKPLLLAGFAILPVRAVLYTLSDDSAWLVAVQLLDGVGAGIHDALTPLVAADLMRGTGRYNLALGRATAVAFFTLTATFPETATGRDGCA